MHTHKHTNTQTHKHTLHTRHTTAHTYLHRGCAGGGVHEGEFPERRPGTNVAHGVTVHENVELATLDDVEVVPVVALVDHMLPLLHLHVEHRIRQHLEMLLVQRREEKVAPQNVLDTALRLVAFRVRDQLDVLPALFGRRTRRRDGGSMFSRSARAHNS